ncbi:hypothetical protein J3Q64DRAFT_1773263 [Phycomyces blakesleeanus]
MYLPDLDDKIRKYEMFKILSCLPCLTRLDIEAKLEDTRPNYTWEVLENIHAYLPRLEYLHTNLPLAAITSADIKTINHVTPAKNLSVIKLLDHNMDLGWLFYFSLKYPKVRVFESSMVFSKINRIEDSPSEEVMSIIMAASFQFPHLKSVVISHEAVVGSQHTVFWKLLHQLTSSLRSLDYSLDLASFGNGLFSGFPRESVRFSSTTLERLSLIINAKPHVMSILPLNFGSCSRLVDLTTEVSKGIIEIDVLLDSCTSLKSIHMRDELITLSPKAYATSTPHGLQKMEIINSKVDSHVFNFISLRCRQLREMALCSVRVPGSISQETGNMCIDMSYTHFEVLKLHDVTFYWLSGELEAVNDRDDGDDQNQEESSSGSSNGNSGDSNSNTIIDISGGDRSILRPYEIYTINLIAIERLNSVLRPRHLGAPKPLIHDGQDHGVSIDKRAWFHHYWGNTNKDRPRQVWMLGKPQVKHVQDYFESFQTSSANDYLSNENRYPVGLVVKRFWKRDLPRGYATLRCGYIGRYDIDGTHFDHDVDVL